MLIVLSSEVAVVNEAKLINGLFDAGLKIFHLRKPNIEQKEIDILLNNVDAKYYAQIALHQHHQMAKEYGINRLHFTETKRKQTDNKVLIDLKANGKILTTSIHQVLEYAELSTCFAYTFFGPVFNSISKLGYASTMGRDFKMPVLQNHPKAIAIGGITGDNLQEAISKQFDGVAALGTIWQQPEHSIEQFKTLQKAWKQTGR